MIKSTHMVLFDTTSESSVKINETLRFLQASKWNIIINNSGISEQSMISKWCSKKVWGSESIILSDSFLLLLFFLAPSCCHLYFHCLSLFSWTSHRVIQHPPRLPPTVDTWQQITRTVESAGNVQMTRCSVMLINSKIWWWNVSYINRTPNNVSQHDASTKETQQQKDKNPCLPGLEKK